MLAATKRASVQKKLDSNRLLALDDDKEREKEIAKKKKSKDSELDDDDEKKPKTLLQYLKLPNIFKRVDPASAMLNVLADSDGVLMSEFKRLKMKKKARDMWIYLWMDIVGPGNTKISYSRFKDYFKIVEGLWTRRLFEIMNQSYTGMITFIEFFLFCIRYLIIDRHKSQEFSFRMLSRRGAAFNDAWSVIDVDDVKNFLNERYDINNPVKRRRRALEIFSVMDKDGDGGLSSSEFHIYCLKNVIFVKFLHLPLVHLRKCIFGTKYWVLLSRKMKASMAGSFDFTSLNKINFDSEKYMTTLGFPVVDSHAKPLDDEIPLLDQGAHQSPKADSSQLEHGPSDDTMENKNKDDVADEDGDDINEPKFISVEANDRDSLGKIIGLKEEVIIQQEEVEEVVDDRKLISFRGELDLSKIPRGVFDVDFHDAVKYKLLKKRQKMKDRKNSISLADKISTRVYDTFICACSDIITGRKGLRLAFEKWLLSVNKKSKKVVRVEDIIEEDKNDTCSEISAITEDSTEISQQLVDLNSKLEMLQNSQHQGDLDSYLEQIEVKELIKDLKERIELGESRRRGSKVGHKKRISGRKVMSIHSRILEASAEIERIQSQEVIDNFITNNLSSYQKNATIGDRSSFLFKAMDYGNIPLYDVNKMIDARKNDVIVEEDKDSDTSSVASI